MKKRFLALFLACVLCSSLFPASAVAAAPGAGSEITLTQFDLCYQSGESQRLSLLGKDDLTVTFSPGTAYYFEVDFDDINEIASVYVTSTTAEGTASLPATYDMTSGTYRTNGWFMNDSGYALGTLRVEYTKKAKEVVVSDSFDVSQFRVPALTESHVSGEVSNNGNTVNASVMIGDLVKEGMDLTLEVAMDTYDESMGTSMSDWMGNYGDVSKATIYYVTGEGGDEYKLHLDYSDPGTYAVIVQKVTGNEAVKMIVDAKKDDIPVGNLRGIAESLSEIGTISGMLVDYTDIQGDCDDLREQVASNRNLTAQQAEAVYQKIDQYEKDQQGFTLIAAVIPMLVPMGAAGGPPGILLSVFLGAMTASASFFKEYQIAGIVAAETELQSVTSGYCGEDDMTTPDVDERKNVQWSLNGGVLSIIGSGAMGFAPDLVTESAYASVRKVVVGSGVTSVNLYMPGRPTMSNVTEVSLLGSVESIGAQCFAGFSSLKSITLPEGVTEIGNSAFRNCTALEDIHLPASLSAIGMYAFQNCDSLQRIYIRGDEPLTFGTSCFPYKNFLQFIFADGPRSVITKATNGSLSSVMPITYGYEHLFTFYYTYGDPKWSDLRTGHGSDFALVALGGPSGFCNTSDTSGTSPQWTMDLDGNLTISGNGEMKLRRTPPWRYVNNFSSVTIEEGVTSIDDDAFLNCTNLASVSLPDSLLSIGDNAFQGCTSLKTFTLPKNAKFDGDPNFFGCTSLNWFSVDSENTRYRSAEGLIYTQVYGQYEGWKIARCPEGRSGAVSIANGTTTIGYNSFIDCKNVTSVSIPASVVNIQTLSNKSPFTGSGITEIYFAGTAAQWDKLDPDGEILLFDMTLYCNNAYFAVSAMPTVNGESGGGTVTGSGMYLSGTQATLKAVPAKGHSFLHWIDESGEILSADANYTVTVNEDQTVYAVFALQPSLVNKNVPLVGEYRYSYEVDVEQTGNDVSVNIEAPYGDSIPQNLAVWVASYDEDGRMLGVTILTEDISGDSGVYSGKVGQDHMQLFILDGMHAPMIRSYWSEEPETGE